MEYTDAVSTEIEVIRETASFNYQQVLEAHVNIIMDWFCAKFPKRELVIYDMFLTGAEIDGIKLEDMLDNDSYARFIAELEPLISFIADIQVIDELGCFLYTSSTLHRQLTEVDLACFLICDCHEGRKLCSGVLCERAMEIYLDKLDERLKRYKRKFKVQKIVVVRSVQNLLKGKLLQAVRRSAAKPGDDFVVPNQGRNRRFNLLSIDPLVVSQSKQAYLVTRGVIPEKEKELYEE